MLDGDNAAYLFRLLSHLKGLPVVRTEAYGAGAQVEVSPFRYFLSQRPLRWALYLTMLVLVLFMVFTARRRQRAIPVIREHFEHGESPEDCMFREVMEETGLTPLSYRFCGIVTFLSDMGTEKEAWEYMCLYHIEEFKGEIKECDEGVLEWVDKEKILDLDLWEGDRLFLRYMQERMIIFFVEIGI